MLNTIHANLDKWVVSFVTTAISSLIWPELPSLILLPFLIALALILVFISKYVHSLSTYLSGALCGFVWIASVGHWYLERQLPREQIRQIHQITGTVDSIIRENKQIRFNFVVDSINDETVFFTPRVRLSWRQAELTIKKGNRLALSVALKPIHGLANQGGFNYQKWLISENIVATGYIKDSNSNRIVEASTDIRQQLIDKLTALNLSQHKWIAALSLGDRSLFTDLDWQIIQRTGTAHLVAISGLHLGIVAFWCYLIFSVLLRFVLFVFPMSQRHDFRRVALIFVLLCTFAYSNIAGFSLPTVRAWIMLTLVSILICSRNNWKVSHIALYSLFVILIAHPLSILAMSFWLSFLAIFFIWFICWRWPLAQRDMQDQSLIRDCWQKFIFGARLQLVLGLLMIPIVAWQFSMISTSATLVNLIAVPLVSFVLVPLCLLGIIFVYLEISYANDVFVLCDGVLQLAIEYLTWVSERQWTRIQLPNIPLTAWGLAFIAVGMWFVPYLPFKKPLLLILLLPLTSFLFENKENNWKINILDVGQGLSVVVMRNQKAVVYDVGGAFPSGFNMADAVILPFLKYHGIKQVDVLLISHFDNDHAGSMSYLSAAMPVVKVSSTRDSCHFPWKLIWQDLQVQTLWPKESSQVSNNDSSCVIRISDNNYSVLLTGDISRNIEMELVKEAGHLLKSDILIAPHHGSNTSSSAAFIQKVNPKYVVFSTGYLNRWNFPKQEVVNRYVANSDALLYSTADSGQVSFFILENEIAVETYREHTHPVWYNRFLDR